MNSTDLLPRFHNFVDDGHTIKVVRALGICQDLSAKYGDKPWIKIKDEEWRNLTYMLLDSTEHDETRWVRSAGFEEAWKVSKQYAPLVSIHGTDVDSRMFLLAID